MSLSRFAVNPAAADEYGSRSRRRLTQARGWRILRLYRHECGVSMRRILVVGIVLSIFLLLACGETGTQQVAPTPDRALTQTAVWERINKDLGATPTP